MPSGFGGRLNLSVSSRLGWSRSAPEYCAKSLTGKASPFEPDRAEKGLHRCGKPRVMYQPGSSTGHVRGFWSSVNLDSNMGAAPFVFPWAVLHPTEPQSPCG